MYNFEGDFLNILMFLHPRIPDFLIVVPRKILSYPNKHQWKDYLISVQIIYKSKFPKMYPYDWFCGPGSHIFYETCIKIGSYYYTIWYKRSFKICNTVMILILKGTYYAQFTFIRCLNTDVCRQCVCIQPVYNDANSPTSFFIISINPILPTLTSL